ncbi:putative enzyme related to lactoylglutathione lyase [Antricoccus suffuscus]|uniref:Putative enzyme related to lactoylglutathione lyase n=1 Tax=Antricoccus suffuscus TaxID=1629062 RepID=A0A2T1A2N8_9ACTN|nr:VOC family protein [Antricoccus suffuscus]PRZ42870.1 putative enzyme related to lactoylglutathione lyase [Antricoccus suffuscus]
MEILSSRVLIRPSDPAASRRFYRDVLGLAIYREFGDPASPSMVFFLGNGLLEVSGTKEDIDPRGVSLWLQVRDVAAEQQRLTDAGVQILRAPKQEFWGLIEMWIADPDGIKIVIVQIPDDHPLRRDQRNLTS